MRILAAVSILAIGAAGCASSPKYRNIGSGHVFARLAAHADNISDILGGAKDVAGAARAMKAYCDPRNDEIAGFDLKAISDAETPAIEDVTAFQVAFERLQKVMLVQPDWFADETFKSQLVACMPMAGGSGEEAGDGEGPQDDFIISAWDMIGNDDCNTFSAAAWECFAAIPEDSRQATIDAFERMGVSLLDLGGDQDVAVENNAKECAELVAVAKGDDACENILKTIEAFETIGND